MSRKLIRCMRRGKRCRSEAALDTWNAVWIAGQVIGSLCPTCQTPQENAEAAVRETIGETETHRVARAENDPQEYIRSLMKTYPAPEVMRHKAAELAAARSDEPTANLVGLMQALAADMEPM
jgi:hypothetical protein